MESTFELILANAKAGVNVPAPPTSLNGSFASVDATSSGTYIDDAHLIAVDDGYSINPALTIMHSIWVTMGRPADATDVTIAHLKKASVALQLHFTRFAVLDIVTHTDVTCIIGLSGSDCIQNDHVFAAVRACYDPLYLVASYIFEHFVHDSKFAGKLAGSVRFAFITLHVNAAHRAANDKHNLYTDALSKRNSSTAKLLGYGGASKDQLREYLEVFGHDMFHCLTTECLELIIMMCTGIVNPDKYREYTATDLDDSPGDQGFPGSKKDKPYDGLYGTPNDEVSSKDKSGTTLSSLGKSSKPVPSSKSGSKGARKHKSSASGKPSAITSSSGGGSGGGPPGDPAAAGAVAAALPGKWATMLPGYTIAGQDVSNKKLVDVVAYSDAVIDRYPRGVIGKSVPLLGIGVIETAMTLVCTKVRGIDRAALTDGFQLCRDNLSDSALTRDRLLVIKKDLTPMICYCCGILKADTTAFEVFEANKSLTGLVTKQSAIVSQGLIMGRFLQGLSMDDEAMMANVRSFVGSVFNAFKVAGPNPVNIKSLSVMKAKKDGLSDRISDRVATAAKIASTDNLEGALRSLSALEDAEVDAV